MDRWTGLSRTLTPLGGYEPKTGGEDAYRTLLAALIAHGTNLGVAAMSGSIEGIRVSDEDMAALNIYRDPFHGEWNYIIKPLKPGNDAVIL